MLKPLSIEHLEQGQTLNDLARVARCGVRNLVSPSFAPRSVVGRFAKFATEWGQATSSMTILSIIHQGYSLRKESSDSAHWTQTEGWISYPAPEPHLEAFLREKTQEWLHLGVLVPAQEFYSPPRNVVRNCQSIGERASGTERVFSSNVRGKTSKESPHQRPSFNQPTPKKISY